MTLLELRKQLKDSERKLEALRDDIWNMKETIRALRREIKRREATR